MNSKIFGGIFLAAVLPLSGCGKKKDDKKGVGASTFPDIYTTVKKSIPSFTKTSLAPSNQFYNPNMNMILTGTVPSSSANFGASTDWTTVSGASSNTIGQLLTDAGQSGTIKSLWTLLAGVQGTITSINTDLADENGEPTNCTAIPNTTNATTPFWSTATGSIVTIADAGKYTCYIESNNAITAFGRKAIEGAAASCTDKFEYYVLQTYAADDAPTSGTDTSYGATSDAGSSMRFYYHGCDKSIKLQIASTSQYSGGTEFSLRTEVTGNIDTSAFTMRASWIDITSNGGGAFNSIVANGTTFKVGDTNGSFLIGDLIGNCPTSSTCETPAGQYNYCIENTGATTTSMAVAAANTTCSGNSTLASGYTGLTPITDASTTSTAGLPRTLFTVSKAAMGL